MDRKSHGVLDVVRNSLGGASLLDSRGRMKMTGAAGRVKGKIYHGGRQPHLPGVESVF